MSLVSYPGAWVENILSVYRSATPDQILAGTNWYDDALGQCESLGVTYGVSTERVAAIVAVLSPRLRWDANIALAQRVLEEGEGLEYPSVLQANLRKAKAIAAGGRIEEYLRGPKVTAFYLNILRKQREDGVKPVTVDIHAVSIALGEEQSHADGIPPQYTIAQFAAAYHEAAVVLGLSVEVVQAVTWEAWRSRKRKRVAPRYKKRWVSPNRKQKGGLRVV